MKRLKSPSKLMLLLVLTTVLLSGCAVTTIAIVNAVKNKKRSPFKLSDSVPEIDKTREAKILAVFFELDNDLPKRSRSLYKEAPGKDGMPIVFSLEVDPSTLDASDFKITTKNGSTFGVEAVTLMPAEEEFELRTALLIGEYGNHPDNPPVALEIVGDLMSRTGVNFKGQTKEIIPLPEGPILSYAEHFSFTEDYPYVPKGDGCDCPKEKTNTVVKVVWAGGVRAVNGKELGDNEHGAFEVVFVQGADTLTVTPFQLADLSDNDNNIDLCLTETGIPIRVAVKENIAIDPHDDKNPKTHIDVVSRR